MTLSTNPPRGTADRYPDEFAVRNYIFTTRRKVCTSFGYEEYLWPLVEDSAIWKAKSGEDVGWTEMTLLTDREGNISDLALRPEMTPTVTRMVVKKWNELPKPVRWFSVANFYRNERPQRWRNREFWQCNVDLFGETALIADIEVLSMALELMKAFGATPEHIELRINHRRLIDVFLSQYTEDTTPLVGLLDKRSKLKPEVMIKAMTDIGIDEKGQREIKMFMSFSSVKEFEEVFANFAEETSVKELLQMMRVLHEQWYDEYIKFTPWLMRGFDYYDGMVFEVFDKHPDNNRALFWWGRYNGLAEIFGAKETIPAVGFAPGDEPMKLFLESWNLAITGEALPRYYVPLIDPTYIKKQQEVCRKLRARWKNVTAWLKIQKPWKAFQYAQKNNYTNVVMVLPDEEQKQASSTKLRITIKNIWTWEESLYTD